MSDLTDEQLDSIEDSLGGPQQVAASKSETCRMLAELRRHRAARVADAERVRSVVREAVELAATKAVDSALGEVCRQVGQMGHVLKEARREGMASPLSAIAHRAAEQLAGAGVGLSAEERNHLLSIRSAIAGTVPTGSWLWKAEFATIDRLLASPTVTLAQVVSAGAARFDARPIERASVEARRELASPDHTAAICALLDSDMPAGDLRKAMAELVGRR